MRYWFTTHYPHDDPGHPWNLYIKSEYGDRAADIRPGDAVLFYEMRGKTGDGRQGIVGVGEVKGELRPNRDRDSGADVGDAEWSWAIDCATKDQNGFVPRDEVNRVLGFAKANPLRIRGGFIPLSREQFEALVLAFARHPRRSRDDPSAR